MISKIAIQHLLSLKSILRILINFMKCLYLYNIMCLNI